MSSSLLYADGKLILGCGQDINGYIMAVDAVNGKMFWKTPRDVSNRYATPVIYHPPRGPAQLGANFKITRLFTMLSQWKKNGFKNGSRPNEVEKPPGTERAMSALNDLL